MDVEHGTCLIIANGEKYLLLENLGDAKYLNLEVVDHETSRNPPARELATDRAGRRYDSTRQMRREVQASGKSGMSETNWHQVAEERFAEEAAQMLQDLVAEGRVKRLVVVADPRTLGSMRQAYADTLSDVLVAEIAKDLTNLPLNQIEASLKAYDLS